MNTETINLMTFGLYGKRTETRQCGSLAKGRTEVMADLSGRKLRCTYGTLWVTIEGDTTDYILTQNQNLAIAKPGKVLVTGPGSYRI